MRKLLLTILAVFIATSSVYAQQSPAQETGLNPTTASNFFYEGPRRRFDQQPLNEVINELHWVGVFNIKYSPNRLDRRYSSQILSLTVRNYGEEGLRLYRQIGAPTFPGFNDGLLNFRINGISPQHTLSRPISSNLESFLRGGELRFTVGPDFYFVGSFGDGLDSPLRGLIYETATNLFAGYFVLHPRHDRLDSFGFPVLTEHEVCLDTEDANSLPASCFGPGAPTSEN